MSKKNHAVDVLLSRASTDRLIDPPPKGDVLARILSTALRAPDHGHMRPWRFIIIAGKHRAAFAELVAKAMIETDPDVSTKKIEKRRLRYASVPMTIVLGMGIQAGKKISEEEQIMAAAAGAMNVLNALHAEGFGGVWLSGAHQNNLAFRSALGLSESQRVLGFIQAGSVDGDPPSAKRPEIKNFFAVWDGAPVHFGADG